jgi:NADH-quinone oxidoreductase subunit J
MVFLTVLAYIFSGLILVGSVGVILSQKAVYSVLFLIFAFLNSAALYVLLGAEFVALSTLIVYVGAVSVLLLFVVMTLTRTEDKITFAQLKPYKKWILGMAGVLALELGLLVPAVSMSSVSVSSISNIKLIGQTLYTKYGLAFQGCAVLLLIAMISAVIITFQVRMSKNVKRQNPTDQINRDPTNVLKMVRVKTGEGI